MGIPHQSHVNARRLRLGARIVTMSSISPKLRDALDTLIKALRDPEISLRDRKIVALALRCMFEGDQDAPPTATKPSLPRPTHTMPSTLKH